jgi:hypothetical protein
MGDGAQTSKKAADIIPGKSGLAWSMQCAPLRWDLKSTSFAELGVHHVFTRCC